jgi:hypothetical protein
MKEERKCVVARLSLLAVRLGCNCLRKNLECRAPRYQTVRLQLLVVGTSSGHSREVIVTPESSILG